MNLYLDTSALVKRYIREAGTDDVNRWIAQAELTATSLITRVEAVAAFARAARIGNITTQAAEETLRLFLTHWPNYMKIPAAEKTINRASTLAWSLGLRGYDAVQLASADLWQTALGAPVVLVTYDLQLAEGGRGIGMVVLPDMSMPDS